jgi:hypothetical protein
MGQLIREFGACLNKEFGWLVDMIVFGHQPGLAAFCNPLACNGHESPFAFDVQSGPLYAKSTNHRL